MKYTIRIFFALSSLIVVIAIVSFWILPDLLTRPGTLTVFEQPTQQDMSYSQSAYRDYVIIHNSDATAFASELNSKLEQGYLVQGELHTERSGAELFEYIQVVARQR